MLKKVCLILIGLFSTSVYAKDALVTGALCLIPTATAAYWIIREPNSEKIKDVNNIAQIYFQAPCRQLLSLTTLEDLQLYLEIHPSFRQDVTSLINYEQKPYNAITARYDSWLKPWNWSQEMKAARDNMVEIHKQIQLLSIFVRYTAIIKHGQQPITDSMLLRLINGLNQATSTYPMVDGLCEIQTTIKKLSTYVSYHCAWTLVELLETLVQEIMCSARYIEERRLMEEYKLKQKLANIEQQKADAQNAQATAQYHQAMALDRQARAQEERNRIQQDQTNFF